MPLTLIAPAASPGLGLDPVRWTGPLVETGGRLGWVPADAAAAGAVVDGDCLALDHLVASEPLPSPLLELLADRALDLDPDTAQRLATRRLAADQRWARALAAAAARRGASPRTLAPPPVHTRLPGGRSWARAAPLGEGLALAEAAGSHLHRADLTGPPRSTLLPGTGPLLLPHPTGPADRVLAVQRMADDTLQAWVLSPDGDPAGPLHGRLGGTLLSWAPTSAGVRVHGDGGVAWLTAAGPGSTVPAIWPYPPTPVLTARGGLLLATQDEAGQPVLAWCHADGGKRGPTAPWPGGQLTTLLPAEHGGWIAGEAGLFALSWSGQLDRLHDSHVLGMVPWGEDVVALHEGGWWRLSDGAGGPLGGYGIDHDGRAVGRDLLLYGMSGWRLLTPAGELRDQAADRGDVSVVDGPEGTVAVLCGTDLACLHAASGRLRARTRTPFDGALYGATDHALIVATVKSGNPRTAGTGWLAYDADLGLLDELLAPPPRRPSGTVAHSALGVDRGLITAKALWWLDGSDLVRWRPELAPPTLRPQPAPRRVREESVLRADAPNPMEAWPEPGLAVDGADVHSERSTYGGSGRYAPAPAVAVRTGRVALLDRCVLAHGGDATVGAAATLILVGCSLGPASPGGPLRVEHDGLLAVLDADHLAGVRVELAHGARLWVDGVLVAQGPGAWSL